MKVVLIAATFVFGAVLAAPTNNTLQIPHWNPRLPLIQSLHKHQETKTTYRNLYKSPVNNAPAPSSHKPSGRIINGEIAKPNSIPYQVFLEVYNALGSWYCGGSLISTQVVLTAGHCGYQADEVMVILGAHEPMKNEPTQIVMKSKDIVVHERFDMTYILNDIALIRLKYPVQLTAAIEIVPLPQDDNNLYVENIGRVSGWGLTEGGSTQLSSELRYTENAIILNEVCEVTYGFIPSYQVCMSGSGGKSSCNGDSGGPLTVNGVQIGVVSYGVEHCLPGYPSVFTRTSSFLKWIEDNSVFA